MKNKLSTFWKSRVVIAMLVVVTLLGSTAALWPKRYQKAPEITFALINGSKLSLTSLRGRPVLVFFWATTCKICIAKTPELNALYDQLKPEGLEMIAVAMPYDPPTHVVAMAIRMKMSYPVALDINVDAVRVFGNVTVTPSTILIAPDGNIVSRKQGKFEIGQLKTRIPQLLQHATAI